MFALFHVQEKRIFIGNILFIVCCVFYLVWWLLAFKPSHAITGIKTGWLLIPASLSGIAGVILIIMGVTAEPLTKQILSGRYILWGGLAVYLILLAITVFLLKRPATTELILIVGWGMLMLAEINALFGMGLFPQTLSFGFFFAVCAAVVISLICYILYYHLDNLAGYIDGMIPLFLAALTMTGISFLMIANTTLPNT